MNRIVTGLLWVAILAAVLLAIFCLDGCANQPTPEQVQAYANAAHTAISGGISDYKEIKKVSSH